MFEDTKSIIRSRKSEKKDLRGQENTRYDWLS
jgi:hypothetical protein